MDLLIKQNCLIVVSLTIVLTFILVCKNMSSFPSIHKSNQNNLRTEDKSAQASAEASSNPDLTQASSSVRRVTRTAAKVLISVFTFASTTQYIVTLQVLIPVWTYPRRIRRGRRLRPAGCSSAREPRPCCCPASHCQT